jgi:hypothetical protein
MQTSLTSSSTSVANGKSCLTLRSTQRFYGPPWRADTPQKRSEIVYFESYQSQTEKQIGISQETFLHD